MLASAFHSNLIMNSNHNLESSVHKRTKLWQVSFSDAGSWGSAKWKKVYSSTDIHKAKDIGREEFPGSQIVQVDQI